MFNSFGNIFRLTSFGESHGPGVGGVIDGFPASPPPRTIAPYHQPKGT